MCAKCSAFASATFSGEVMFFFLHNNCLQSTQCKSVFNDVIEIYSFLIVTVGYFVHRKKVFLQYTCICLEIYHVHCLVFVSFYLPLIEGDHYIEDITCPRVDMNLIIIFKWSTQYLTSTISSRAGEDKIHIHK